MRIRSDRRLLLCSAFALALLTGCAGAIVGDWRFEQARPSREVFAMDDVRFERGGTYSATVTLDGRTSRENGAFSFNGFKLTLRPQAGGQREYNASARMQTLELSDKDRHVVLRKAKS